MTITFLCDCIVQKKKIIKTNLRSRKRVTVAVADLVLGPKVLAK
jgi:hypothetical protein